MTKTEMTVLRFGDRRVPRPLRAWRPVRIESPAAVDEAIGGARRVAVLGSDADLAAVLTRLIRTDLLDVEVAHVRPGLRGRLDAHRAVRGSAQRVPLIRDDSGTAVVGAAEWLPPEGSALVHGEAVVDDTALFDGDAPGLRIEPTSTLPGLRARVTGGRWVSGRAVQLGTTGVRVVRDGVPAPRELKRSTFYRHTTGWLRVR